MSALTLRNLRKTYRNGVEALKGIDLAVDRGDFLALLGPNGAGKSTAIGIVSSLVRKSGGQVMVMGHDLDRDPEQAKSCIGLVPQEFNFNQFEPVAEIVVNQAGFYGIPRRRALARAKTCLQQLDLWDRRACMARELSGGMKRRLMIARALAHEPQLLILDEPTAGVDVEIRRSMWDFLRETNANGTTIILTTHYLEEAESLCRNIAIINHGKIVEQGQIKALLNRLHRETLVLSLKETVALGIDLPGYPFKTLDDSTIEVDIINGRGISRLIELLSQQGIEVASLRNKQNRLEQLFIDMLDGRSRPSEEKHDNR